MRKANGDLSFYPKIVKYNPKQYLKIKYTRSLTVPSYNSDKLGFNLCIYYLSLFLPLYFRLKSVFVVYNVIYSLVWLLFVYQDV